MNESEYSRVSSRNLLNCSKETFGENVQIKMANRTGSIWPRKSSSGMFQCPVFPMSSFFLRDTATKSEIGTRSNREIPAYVYRYSFGHIAPRVRGW